MILVCKVLLRLDLGSFGAIQILDCILAKVFSASSPCFSLLSLKFKICALLLPFAQDTVNFLSHTSLFVFDLLTDIFKLLECSLVDTLQLSLFPGMLTMDIL